MRPDLASLEEIFGEAVSKSDQTARAAYLDEACGGDVTLRARIEALLSGHEEIGRAHV